MKTIIDWIAKYEKKVEPIRLPAGYTFIGTNEEGFVMYRIAGDIMWINQGCGIASVWIPRMEKIARDHGCKKIFAPTFHKEKAFSRLFGGKYIYEYEDRGNTYHVFVREVNDEKE